MTQIEGLNEDFRDLLACLAAEGVEFVIVGAYAVAFHGVPRTTGDIDVFVRPTTHIPVVAFDGHRIPFDDAEFDAVVFVDVLHHTEDPMELLREAVRVAPGAIIVKDHAADGPLARPILRLMDWVGNAHHGVALPYNYWSTPRWQRAVAELGLRTEVWQTSLGLYPPPASWIFERELHLLCRLAAS